MSWYYYSDAKEAKARIKKEIAKRQKSENPFASSKHPQATPNW
jgi:hypothetical protein